MPPASVLDCTCGIGTQALPLAALGYRVTGTDATTNPSSNSWDVAFRGDLVYLFDMSRGVEVLRLDDGARAAARMQSVTAPSVRSDRLAAKPVSSLVNTGDPNRFICPLFE